MQKSVQLAPQFMRALRFEGNMNNLVSAIELGKQRGLSKNLMIDGVSYWADAAIQKYESTYKAHVSIIKESNMNADIYDVYFTREFLDLDSAILCIESHGPIKFNEFNILKGQRIFDPKGNEENGT
jgi:hypothetical protein